MAELEALDNGKPIVQAAAGNLKKVRLEPGGKSPAIVFPDADLSVAIPGAANGIVFNMGQCCTAGSRLFVHERTFDKVRTALADKAAKLMIGPGLNPETRIGPLVSDEQSQRVTGCLDSGRQQGAEVVTGGKHHRSDGYFVEPTVPTRTTPEMKVVRGEIVGPVVCAMPRGDDLDRIAKQGNAPEYGPARRRPRHERCRAPRRGPSPVPDQEAHAPAHRRPVGEYLNVKVVWIRTEQDSASTGRNPWAGRREWHATKRGETPWPRS